jgi:hypothetical protein
MHARAIVDATEYVEVRKGRGSHSARDSISDAIGPFRDRQLAPYGFADLTYAR